MATEDNGPADVPMLPVDDPGAKLLAVPYFGQRPYADLCWAACCEMVLAFNRLTVPSLCQLASEVSGEPCCSNQAPDGCDQGHWPDDVYQQNGIQCASMEGPLSLANVIYEIDHGRAVHAVLQWSGGAKHIIVICGYYPNGDVLVKDPLYGVGRLAFEYVAVAYNMGSWSDSYYNLGRAT